MRVALLVLALLVPAVATADAIGPPPDSCPNGSVGVGSHCGAVCLPRSCGAADDEPCEAGEVCREVRACIDTRSCAGAVSPAYLVDVMTARCDASERCDTGTCEAVHVCVAQSNPSNTEGGGCAGGGASPGSLVLAALAFVKRRS